MKSIISKFGCNNNSRKLQDQLTNDFFGDNMPSNPKPNNIPPIEVGNPNRYEEYENILKTGPVSNSSGSASDRKSDRSGRSGRSSKKSYSGRSGDSRGSTSSSALVNMTGSVLSTPSSKQTEKRSNKQKEPQSPVFPSGEIYVQNPTKPPFQLTICSENFVPAFSPIIL